MTLLSSNESAASHSLICQQGVARQEISHKSRGKAQNPPRIRTIIDCFRNFYNLQVADKIVCVGTEVAVPLPHRVSCKHPQPLPARAVQNQSPQPKARALPVPYTALQAQRGVTHRCIHPRPAHGWRPDLCGLSGAVTGVCGWVGGCAPVSIAGFICLWGEGAATRPGTSARPGALLPVPRGRAPAPPGTSAR